jgi:hypothetical protein
MNKLNKIAIAVAISVTAGLAATAYAHQGEGRGMGPGAQGGQHQGMQGGITGHGQMQGMGGGRGEGCDAGKNAGNRPQAGQQLMTPEERTAMREKMRSAKTPEERQQIALANRAEMQKRATEKGITLPEHRGPHGHAGMGPDFAPKAPATPEAAQ